MLDHNHLTICPICQEPLTLLNAQRAFRCTNNHFFDIAKQGYINLLSSNQKKSKLPGDSKVMVSARRLFLQRGHYAKISDKLSTLIIEDAEKKTTDVPYTILDLGCGEGYYTGQLMSALSDAEHYGIDISKEAVKCASATSKKASWIVGTNYHLPFKSDSFDCIFSVFSPVLASECSRVLKKGGIFLRILPATRHLIEIRDIIYPETILSEDSEKAQEQEGFSHIRTESITYAMDLDQEELLELVQMTPHYWKTSRTDKNALKEFSALNVTVSMLILIYQKL